MYQNIVWKYGLETGIRAQVTKAGIDPTALLSVKEAARILSIGRSKLYELIAAGDMNFLDTRRINLFEIFARRRRAKFDLHHWPLPLLAIGLPTQCRHRAFRDLRTFGLSD